MTTARCWAHEVVLESLLVERRLLLLVVTDCQLFLEHVHHDFTVGCGLASCSSDQAAGFDDLGGDRRGCHHVVGARFLGRRHSGPRLPARDHGLIWRWLVEHIWEGQVVRALQRYRVNRVVLLVLIVPRVRDA